MTSHGAISLEASVRTCDVNVGEATRIQSDRFFNPSNMVCIPWSGLNNKGQEVCPDSFWTKTPGCDSAEDRILVENAQRPKYMNYVTLSAGGIDGHIYGNQEAAINSQGRAKFDQDRNKYTGNFGNQFGATNQYSCGVNAYENNMAQMAQLERKATYLNNGFKSAQYRQMGGY